MTRQDWLNMISDGMDAIQELAPEVGRLSSAGQFHLLFLKESLQKMWHEFPSEGTPPEDAESHGKGD